MSSSRLSLDARLRHCLSTLQPLGFPEHQCRAAAEACSGDVERATEYLLSGSANIPPPPPPHTAAIKPAGSSARDRARQAPAPAPVAAAAAASGARPPSPSFHAHAPSPLSTPASRSAAGLRSGPNPALSPSAVLAAAMQSPKRHLVNPASGGGGYPPPPVFAPPTAAAGGHMRGAALAPYSSAARPPSPAAAMVDVPGRLPSPAARSNHSLRMHLSDDSMDTTDTNGTAATPAATASAAAPSSIKFTQQSAMSTRSSGPISARHHLGNGTVPQAASTPRDATPYQSSLSRLKVAVPPPTPAAAAGAGAPTPQSAANASDLSPYAPALSPPALQSLLTFLSSRPPPASRSAASLRTHTLSLGTESLPLGPNSFIDVRDPLGKWLEAQVLRNEWTGVPHNLEHLAIHVHYVDWDDKWNETLTPIQDPSRIAPFRTWSESAKELGPAAQAAALAAGSRSVAPAWVREGDSVVCYFLGDDRKRGSHWLVGRITKVDGPQMQVETVPPLLPAVAASLAPTDRAKKVQRWFHAHSDLILPINRALNELQAVESAQREQLRQQRYYEQQQQQAALHEQQQNQLSPSPSPFSPVADVTSPGGMQSAAQHHGATSPVPRSQQAQQQQQQQQQSLSGSGPRTPLTPQHHSRASADGSARLGSYSSAPAAAQSLSLSLSQSQHGSASNLRQSSVPVIPSQFNSSIPFTQAPPQHSTSPPPAAAASSAAAAAAPTSKGVGASASDPAWFVGLFLEVKDSVGKFLAAEVKEVQQPAHGSVRIFVHYEGWSRKWDEWLDVVRDASRIRALGSALEESAEEKARKEEELQFRARMLKQHGFTIVDCESDGNCLFRAVAHQIYGDVNRHPEVRRACYDYMCRDAAYFSTFVSEPFDQYVSKRRADKEWGDHLEVVALRELFNKNVEIYSAKDQGVRGCQPIGSSAGSSDGGADDVPMMRISFHGKNHYNSVVDPKHPPPLGDGKDCKVNMRAMRQAQEAAEAESAAKRAREHAEAAEIDERKTDSSSSSAAYHKPAPRSSGAASPTPMSPMSPARTHSGSGGGHSGNKLVRSSSSGPNAISPMALAASPARGAAAASGPSPPRVTPPSSGGGRAPADPLSSPRRSVSLFRDTSLASLPATSLFPESALQVEWSRLDPKHLHHIAERHVSLLIANIAERLFVAQKDAAVAADNQSRMEHLEKVYDEWIDSGEIERMSQAMLAVVPVMPVRTPAGHMVNRIPFQSFQHYLYAHTLKEIMWAFSR